MSKLTKRKNQAADDSFNTSLPHTPEKSTPTAATTFTLNKQRRATKKSRPQSEHAFISSTAYSSSPVPPSPLLTTYNSSSTFHPHPHHLGSSSSRHSPIPAQWITKPSVNSSSFSSHTNSTSSYKSPHCLRHGPSSSSSSSALISRATSNPSFVHSVAAYPCTCHQVAASAAISTNSINFETLPANPPSVPAPAPAASTSSRLFSSHFQANLHLRRSYIKSKNQPLTQLPPQLPSATFDQLSSTFQASSRLRRANSVMFHSRAERTTSTTSSSTSSNVLTKSQSKWSFGNLLSKISASIGGQHTPAKVKRE